MLFNPLRLFVASATLLSFSALSASASLAFQDGVNLTGSGVPLSGTVTTEIWNQLTTARINNNPLVTGDNTTRPYGWHSLNAAWNNTLVSNAGANAGSSSLWKSGGYGYIASGSLHQGYGGLDIVAGGDFVISSIAISGLETVIFQIEATDRNEQVFSSMPTLTIGGETYEFDFSSLYYSIENFSVGGFGAQDKDYYAFQWDLSSLNIAAGTAFTINFTGLANSGIYEMQLNQGDDFVQVVPEPSTYVLIALGAIVVLFRIRRKVAVAR